MTVLGEQTPSKTAGGPSGSSSPVSNSTGDDARVPENDLNKSSTEVWRDTKLFSFRISSQKQTSPVQFSMFHRAFFNSIIDETPRVLLPQRRS